MNNGKDKIKRAFDQVRFRERLKDKPVTNSSTDKLEASLDRPKPQHVLRPERKTQETVDKEGDEQRRAALKYARDRLRRVKGRARDSFDRERE